MRYENSELSEHTRGSIEPASRAAGQDSPLGDTEIYYATSPHVDEVFKIFVEHCGTQRAARPCALLCVTDANGFFGAAILTLNRALRVLFDAPR